MNQYNTKPESGYKKPAVKSNLVQVRPIDTLAKEVVIDDVRLVLVNAEYVANLEKRIRALEQQLGSLKDAKNQLMQKVKSLK